MKKKFNALDRPTIESIARDDDPEKTGYLITCGKQTMFITGVQLGLLMATMENGRF